MEESTIPTEQNAYYGIPDVPSFCHGTIITAYIVF